jgi:HD-like signal output (HDOD) protein
VSASKVTMAMTRAPLRPQAAVPSKPGPADFSRLHSLIPLRRLSDDDFTGLMQSASYEHLAAGKVLFRSGIDEASIFYLIEGTLEIADEHGGSMCLVGGSIETAHPLSAHPRVRCLATAASAIVFVRLPKVLLEISTPVVAKESFKVEEMTEDSENFDNRIVFDLYHALMEGSFDLPVLPDIALHLRTAASNPDASVDELTRIVQSDPAVAGYIMRLANNAAYSGVARVTEVRDALVRIGVPASSDMITAYTLRNLYTAPDPVSRLLMQAAWRHSARIASLSFVIARHTRRINPEQALLGGLLHDIGMLIIIREWHARSVPPLKSAALQQLGGELCGSLGSMVLRNWQMPDNLVTATLEAENWSRSPQEALCLCDCVILAHAHDTSPPPWATHAPALSAISAYDRIPDGTLTSDGRLAIVTAADAELDLLDGALQG